MNTRQANKEIKQAEKDLKKVLQTYLITPVNLRLNEIQLEASKKVLDCLKNEKLDAEEAYLCKAEVEKKFLEEQERITFFANVYNKKLSGCLG
jgi:ABC-type arginine transport system ATPase subunit